MSTQEPPPFYLVLENDFNPHHSFWEVYATKPDPNFHNGQDSFVSEAAAVEAAHAHKAAIRREAFEEAANIMLQFGYENGRELHDRILKLVEVPE